MKSLFTPLLICIQSFLIFEVIAIWLNDIIMALVFRIMIGFFVYIIYYFKTREEYNVELTYLLTVITIQDIIIAIITRGLLNLYSFIVVYIPILIMISREYYIIIQEKYNSLTRSYYHYYNQNEDYGIV